MVKSETFVEHNVYFKRLRLGLMSIDNFYLSQYYFRFAVQEWPNHFLRLARRTNKTSHRRILIKNVLDELGETDNASHVATFDKFLSLLWEKTQDKEMISTYIEKNPVLTFIQSFNTVVKLQCSTLSVDKAFCLLGAIEHAFVHVSDFLNHYLTQEIGIAKNGHYEAHSELDIHHAEELLAVSSDEESMNCGLDIFFELFTMMTTFFENDVPFAHSFEDPGPELQVVQKLLETRDDLTVQCILSGGDVVYSVASALGTKGTVIAIDNQEKQFLYAVKRLTQHHEHLCVLGRFEIFFALLDKTNEKAMLTKDFLQRVFGPAALGTDTEAALERLKILRSVAEKDIARFTTVPVLQNVITNAVFRMQSLQESLISEKVVDLTSLSNVLDWSTFSTVCDVIKLLYERGDVFVIDRRMHGPPRTDLWLVYYSEVACVTDNFGLYETKLYKRLQDRAV